MVNLAVVALMVCGVATASTIEDAAQDPCEELDGLVAAHDLCVYQHDGGEHGDATDDCTKANRFPSIGDSDSGMLVLVDDPVDHYHITVDSDTTITADIDSLFALAPANVFRVTLYNDDCSSVVAAGVLQPDGSIRASANVGAGTYALQIAIVIEGAVPESEGVRVAVDDPLGSGNSLVVEISMRCHPFCIKLANAAVGYMYALS